MNTKGVNFQPSKRGQFSAAVDTRVRVAGTASAKVPGRRASRRFFRRLPAIPADPRVASRAAAGPADVATLCAAPHAGLYAVPSTAHGACPGCQWFDVRGHSMSHWLAAATLRAAVRPRPAESMH